VEWTLDEEGRLHVVQSRPITTAGRPPAPATLWSNANVSENFPAPISPLLYSIAEAGYYHYFRGLGRAFGLSARRLGAMEHHLRRLIGVHGARMYYNLTSIHAVLRIAPFGAYLTGAFNEFVGASQTASRARGSVTWREAGRRGLGRAVELAVIATKTGWQYAFLGRRIAAFERRIDRFAARTDPPTLVARPLAKLLDDFRAFLEIRCRHWTDAALADAASMVCYGVLQRLLHAAFPGADQQALHNTLLKGLPDLVSSVPALKLWELSRRIRETPTLSALFASGTAGEILARLGGDDPTLAAFRRELDEFLEHWGFRCSGELMLTVPSFQEDPAALLEILKTYASVDGEAPAAVLRRQETERLAETARVLAALRQRPLGPLGPGWGLARAVALVLDWTQRAVAYRERARLKQALLYSRCRRIVLAIGDRMVALGHLAVPDDVFFLTADELDALLSGAAMFPYHVRELVARRRREHAELAAMTPPDTFTLPAGDYLAPGARPEPAEAGLAPASHADLLRGLGACGGRATGRATVLGDVAEAGRLVAGDVLVTRQTDPGWAPVFFLIRGLVMERGGMLSHGSIIAREFGLPAVVGVADATRRIPSGATVAVDGDQGLVRVVGG
jgi:pyruvate,water dikinase